MSYSPNNTPVYNAAFSGIAGFYGAQLNAPQDYAELADAWAQALDTVWGANPYSLLEITLIEAISIVQWQGQAPATDGHRYDPTYYAAAATEVVALVQAGNAQVVAEGINPNVGRNGFGEISFQDSAVGLVLTTQNTYYQIASWNVNQSGQGVVPNASAGTLTIQQAGWYQTICTLSIQSANNISFNGALFVNNTLHSNGKVQWSTSGITGTPIINLTIADVNFYNAGDVLSVKIESTSSSGVTTTPLQGNFFVVQIG